jgi:hypothetical protein
VCDLDLSLSLVTQVAEEMVLSDPTGLHMGAGPYMLFYSRSDSQPVDAPLYWPKTHRVSRSALCLVTCLLTFTLQADIKESNESFRMLLPEELSRDLVEFPSPPLTPVHMEDASSAHSEGQGSNADMHERSQTQA